MRYFVKSLCTSAVLMLMLMAGYCFFMPNDEKEMKTVMGRPGDSGEEVVLIQTRLREYGYDVGEVTGVYDLSTAEAVRRFQEDYGLDVSGNVNAETMYRLGFTVETETLCLYESRRFIASSVDAICPDATYLAKVALAGLILERQANVGFPDELPAVVFGEPQFRDALLYDYGKEPSADAWRAVRDAANGMSPCPDALYFYRKGNEDRFLTQLNIVFKNGTYYFAAPPAE